MQKLEWRTEKRKINDLLPFEHNPRQLTEPQFEQLKKSLEKFNLVEIPAIDTDNKIVAGHQRIHIMRMIGRGDEQIDIRVPNRKLSDEEFLEYNLRSNKNTGEWDFDILANMDEEVLKGVGFDMKEIFGAEELPGIDLPDGERKPFQQMTFTLSHAQAEMVKAVLKIARGNLGEMDDNKNSNGNALAEVCKFYGEHHKTN